MVQSDEVEGSLLATVLSRFRIVLGLATLVMVGLSWKLWVDPSSFPRVPFIRELPIPSWGVSRSMLAVLVISLAGLALPIGWRWATWLSVILIVFLVLEDQNRLQPWIYQYVLTGLAIATAPRVWAIRLARLCIILIYVHSGLSKLDLTFTLELGRLFLETLVRPLGLSPRNWPEWVRVFVILGFPAFELAVGLGLAFRRTRRVALAGAIVQHLAILAILGPWGLGHSTIVLVWNISLIVEDLVLFYPAVAFPDEAVHRGLSSLPWVAWLFVVAALAPFTERWGFWDTWPSFAVYASHNERTDVDIQEDEVGGLPPEIQRHLVRSREPGWVRLDLTGWSREERGVPIYPQSRNENGLAEAIANRFRNLHFLRVTHWGRADRFTARRSREVSFGPDAIRRRGDRYWWNAHPSIAWTSAENSRW